MRHLVTLVLISTCWAANPGKHTVSVSWQDTCLLVCSYNVYRFAGTTDPCTLPPPLTPYASSVAALSYTDSSTPAGTYTYNVSAVDLATGGESACASQATQATVPAITTPIPTAVTGIVN